FSNQKMFINNKSGTLEEMARLEIYNVAGKLVHTEYVNMTMGTSQVKLPFLNNGAYIGRLSTDVMQINEKFVISQ
ncbi:MAG: hypothetical protein ACI8ZM_005606, partial [Crocinitomix sp.]